MSYFCPTNLLQDTQRQNPAETAPKGRQLILQCPSQCQDPLEGDKAANPCGLLQFRHTLLRNNHFRSHFLQLPEKKINKINSHLSKSQHYGQEMRVTNARACALLPCLPYFHVPTPSETQWHWKLHRFLCLIYGQYWSYNPMNSLRMPQQIG